jgi:SAM-dependent methyltransferase/uncharacterized protein YbaR (Trm112 family)
VRGEELERLRPVCPACRAADRGDVELELGTVARAEGDDVIEGALVCPERLCRREHPILDGIPIVVLDVMSWATHQLDSALRRDDITAFTESMLGDAAGPGSGLDRERSNLSGYGRGHWGDLDDGHPLPADESFAVLVRTALDLLPEPPQGPWIDVGCAVGRGTLELARATGEPAVGVDLSFAMLRVAERVRRHGVAVYPQRRVGIVYDRREVPVPDVPADRLGFWCADAEALPFAAGTFAGALSLNVLDCVRSPLGHLLELGRVLAPGAPALLSTPYDWSVAATPVEQWIGGHSQRGPAGGSSAEELRRILSPDAAAGVDTGLVVAGERDGIPWRVHANERSHVEYALHLLRLERRPV